MIHLNTQISYTFSELRSLKEATDLQEQIDQEQVKSTEEAASQGEPTGYKLPTHDGH